LIAGIPLQRRLAPKRSHIDEDGSGNKGPEINRHDGGHFRGAGWDIDHLPGLQHDTQLGICRKIDEDLAAQADYLDPSQDSRN
jgi:hypothetical protein